MLASFNFPEERFQQIFNAAANVLKKHEISFEEEKWPHISIAFTPSVPGMPEVEWTKEEQEKVLKFLKGKRFIFKIKGMTVFTGREGVDYLVVKLDSPQPFYRLKKRLIGFGTLPSRTPHCSILHFKKKDTPRVKEILEEIVKETKRFFYPFNTDLNLIWGGTYPDYEVYSVGEEKNRLKKMFYENQEDKSKKVTTKFVFRATSGIEIDELRKNPKYEGNGDFGLGTYFALNEETARTYLDLDVQPAVLGEYKVTGRMLEINAKKESDFVYGKINLVNLGISDQLGRKELGRTDELGKAILDAGYDAVILKGYIDGGEQLFIPSGSRAKVSLIGYDIEEEFVNQGNLKQMFYEAKNIMEPPQAIVDYIEGNEGLPDKNDPEVRKYYKWLHGVLPSGVYKVYRGLMNSGQLGENEDIFTDDPMSFSEDKNVALSFAQEAVDAGETGVVISVQAPSDRIYFHYKYGGELGKSHPREKEVLVAAKGLKYKIEKQISSEDESISLRQMFKNPVYEGKNLVRLYRGMQNEFDPSYDKSLIDAPHGYSSWTDSLELAKQYAGKDGFVYYIDLPKSEEGKSAIDENPKSDAYGDRVLFFFRKPAGLNGVVGKEFLVYTDHDLYDSSMIKNLNLDEMKQMFYENEIEDGYEIKNINQKMYHGSVTPINDWTMEGLGRFGKGLYLALDRKWADFHAKGGRQGVGSYRMKQEPGYIYEFRVKGKALIVTDEFEFLKYMVSEYEPAEEEFSRTGDLTSNRISKFISDFARENFDIDMVVFDPKESDVLSPFSQALILNKNAVKLVDGLDEMKQMFYEVHYKDIYGSEFDEFRKKYAKNTYKKYVQFTNFATDVLEKKPYEDPTHSDPVGVYGYPIEYVIKHPADVWYGQKAKFMRVIYDSSKNKLDLQSLTEDEAKTILMRMFGWNVPEVDKKWREARKLFKERAKRVPQTFVTIVQMDWYSTPEKQKNPEVRSGIEQTKLLRKVGFDAVEDTARNANQAAINSREPEQIIFLHRGAFEILETVRLTGKKGEHVGTSDDPSHLGRKLAAQIATAMGDVLTSDSGEAANKMGWEFFWTKQGKQIEIEFERPSSYYVDKKLGEKKHKEAKLSTPYAPKVVVRTPIGEFSIRGDGSTQFKDIVKTAEEEWSKLQENPKEGESYSKSSMKEKEKKEYDLYIKQKYEKENQEYLDSFEKEWESFKKLADYYDMKVDKPSTDLEKISFAMLLSKLSRRSTVAGYEQARQGFSKYEEFNKLEPYWKVIDKAVENAKSYEAKNFRGMYWLLRDVGLEESIELEEAKKKKKKRIYAGFGPYYGKPGGQSPATMPQFRRSGEGISPKQGPASPGPGGVNAPGVPAGPNAGMGPIVASRDGLTESEKYILYHTSNDPNLKVVLNIGEFGGIFASTRPVPGLSNGKYIYRLTLDEKDILTNSKLLYHTDWSKVYSILSKISGIPNTKENRSGKLKKYGEFVSEEISQYTEGEDGYTIVDPDIEEMFGETPGWEQQRVRGLLANKLGYKAVTTEDEYGISYLILPGVKLEKKGTL